ncbi:MAG TPA: hypothetical protein VGF51_08960 [Acidimicrobiales bacterium]|jgi:hypothetical protein
MTFEIPPEYEPHDDQIPSWATDIGRFRICYAITLRITGKYDPVFCEQLYNGDIDTGEDIAEPTGMPPHPNVR